MNKNASYRTFLAGVAACITITIAALSLNAFAANDSDAVPLKRIPPVMPGAAMHSGYCNLSFDLTKDGNPINIKTIMCTDNLFEPSLVSSVGKWKYTPKIKDGKPVPRPAIETQVTFFLSDQRGNKIPETEPVDEDRFVYDGDKAKAKIVYQMPPYNGRPNKGEKSAYCCMAYSVSQIGTPFNVIAENCSRAGFSQFADELIRGWMYAPVKKNGIAVSSGNYSQVIYFVHRPRAFLRDPNGYTPIPGTPDDTARTCRLVS